MADNSKIEWTDATWNPVTGCDVVSPGCTNCYAMKLAGTRLKHHPSRAGLTRMTKAGPVWNGQVRFNEDWLLQPLTEWRRPRRIFVAAHGDLFHDAVREEWLDLIFAVMALCPQHTFQILTKRADRMRAYLSLPETPLHRIHSRAAADMNGEYDWIQLLAPKGSAITPYNLYLQVRWPLPNVWLGVSAEDQQHADERIPLLLRTPAAKRFVSAEPLLGPISLERIDLDGHSEIFPLRGTTGCQDDDGSPVPDWPKLDWVIAGGESGDAARPSHPDWFRALRDQCADAGVPFFFKQWGEYHPSADHDPATCPVARRTPDLIHVSGERHFDSATGLMLLNKPGWAAMCRVGKKAAGALLDGQLYRQLPPFWQAEAA